MSYKALQTVLQMYRRSWSTLAVCEPLSGNADTFLIAGLAFVVITVKRAFALLPHMLNVVHGGGRECIAGQPIGL